MGTAGWPESLYLNDLVSLIFEWLERNEIEVFAWSTWIVSVEALREMLIDFFLLHSGLESGRYKRRASFSVLRGTSTPKWASIVCIARS